MKTLVAQLDILETMTPMSFASFRDRSHTSAGFNRISFAKIEFILAYKRPEAVGFFKSGDPGFESIAQAIARALDHRCILRFSRTSGCRDSG